MIPYVREFHPFTGWRWLRVEHDRCVKCGRENPDLAHHVHEYVVALLAERLRNAFDDHYASCPRCTSGRGFLHCEEAMALWELMPDGDRVLIA